MNLLITEQPLLFSATLAERIGLNEAIFMQQLHFWIGRCGKNRDGKRWIWNSVREWNEQFPFWSYDTVRRTIESCHTKGLIITGNYNRMAMDRTKWYTIDYDSALLQIDPTQFRELPQSNSAKCTDADGQDAQSNTIEYPIDKPIDIFDGIIPANASRLSATNAKRKRVIANNDMMVKVGKWFGRRPDTKWSVYEALALKQAEPSDEELMLVEGYYSANIPEDKDYRRRTIETLLNNWPSEVDKARRFMGQRQYKGVEHKTDDLKAALI